MTTQETLVDQSDNETEKSSVISVVKGMISEKTFCCHYWVTIHNVTISVPP